MRAVRIISSLICIGAVLLHELAGDFNALGVNQYAGRLRAKFGLLKIDLRFDITHPSASKTRTADNAFRIVGHRSRCNVSTGLGVNRDLAAALAARTFLNVHQDSPGVVASRQQPDRRGRQCRAARS